MRPSDRVLSLPDPAGNAWAIFERARAMQEAGRPVTMLSIGDHDRTTPAALLDQMAQSARAGNTGYAPVPGAAALRAAIAARAARITGAATTPEEVTVTPGGQFALYAALIATLDPGDRVVMIDPYYATYPLTIRAASGTAVICPADPDRGFQPDLAALAEAAKGARALLINSPNNPTGAVYSAETLHGIAEICRKEDLWLISDEVYDSQIWDGKTHLSPRSLPGMAERTIVIGSLSKSHVMTGSRLGWMIAPRAVIAPLWEFQIATTYGVPGYTQDMAMHALTHGDAIAAEVTATYAARRDMAVRLFEGANAVRLSPPEGAMYVMLDVRATGLSGVTFAERLLDTHAIAVMPGEGFGAAAAGHVRVALTVEDAALAEALVTLRRFADAL
ncbi:arginine:pyruvate transaminase [Rubricella aquisinus]|uniref:Aminotransferase n=1 Tax=Rubricella aquisinus TaxID=2028108 RepID=A0A840WKG6_9RHOB|nr:aminotransferase class I/II-fold pyridoxal phosphate-dependent enzyme [Rubricella aquisinus]MBB5515549.1 arginine:pyruvate transaminase [Rubricella aquisinus]